ncbi:MAG: putative metal-dependent hydrolase YfiT [Gemmatimonadaceae bacterium]|nr:putative metal-dependent hydrolase YfiT [Gemmatimonadaceae bacterium]
MNTRFSRILMSTDLRYPIGRFVPPLRATAATRSAAITAIAQAPDHLRDAVADLTHAQLETPYRPGGWTVRQVVHHVADSHVNAYVRLRLTLAEDVPTVRPYDETRWAELVDAKHMDVQASLSLLDALHERFVALLQSLGEDDWQRRYRHPESGEHDLDYLLEMYAWHGRHHAAHITALRDRLKWR